MEEKKVVVTLNTVEPGGTFRKVEYPDADGFSYRDKVALYEIWRDGNRIALWSREVVAGIEVA